MTDAQERRQARLLSLVDVDGEVAIKRVCEVSAEVTDASGCGIMFMAGDIARGSLYSTDAISATIEELQFSLGEGPCVDAYREDRPVSEPDLTDPAATRWPAFTEGAIDAGARSVFCFPLHVGAVRLGAIDLYRRTTGPLTDEQHANALAMADIATRSVLVLQAEAPPASWRPPSKQAPISRSGCTRPQAWSPPSSVSPWARRWCACAPTRSEPAIRSNEWPPMSSPEPSASTVPWDRPQPSREHRPAPPSIQL